MPGGLNTRSIVAAALALGGLALSLLFAAPGRGEVAISCSYVEAGAPGPAGNVLRIDDRTESVTHIYREGEEIVVFNNLSRDPTSCAGGTPTVLTTDRIEYSSSTGVPFINYLGDGALAPGATLEPDGSEIEVLVEEGYRPQVLNVGGTSEPETIVAGRLGQRRLGVNLNSRLDENKQDADVILDPADPTEAVVRVVGKAGPDRLSALGGPGFTGSFPADRLLLSGGPGDDTLLGGPNADRLSGGEGDDTLLGGRGKDRLTIGPGSDRVRAGKGSDSIENRSDVGGIPADTGPDRILAGAGNDHVSIEQSPRGNTVRCGSGSRDSAIVNLGDRITGCEQVDVTRR